MNFKIQTEMLIDKINILNVSLIISIVAIFISIMSFVFKKRIRQNDIRPFFEDTNNSFGSSNKGEKIPIINIILKNSGGKAVILKIEEKTKNKIYCTQANSTVENLGIFELKIKSNTKILFEEFEYKLNVFFKDIDNHIYIQKIHGRNIYFNVLTLKRCIKIGSRFFHF